MTTGGAAPPAGGGSPTGPLAGAAVDPQGGPVVLLKRLWEGKITRDHPELRVHAGDVLTTVAEPEHVEDDPLPQRRRYYRRGLGPSRWLLVVVSYEQLPARIITAVALRKDPKLWNV